ncbi:hypothetical protein J2S04_001765 [Alicyclobacillus tengchongensis]|uniref:Uncharacterized protein n=1 Tax=Alicyclobacillus tolerans TaxID=90970 RepID=A0ABT9LX07_9BACL|nr:hypothetical protein [Alicyclobacillus tengchongensis]
MNLEYEYQAYEMMGRKEKAMVLREWLDWKQCNSPGSTNGGE